MKITCPCICEQNPKCKYNFSDPFLILGHLAARDYVKNHFSKLLEKNRKDYNPIIAWTLLGTKRECISLSEALKRIVIEEL